MVWFSREPGVLGALWARVMMTCDVRGTVGNNNTYKQGIDRQSLPKNSYAKRYLRYLMPQASLFCFRGGFIWKSRFMVLSAKNNP